MKNVLINAGAICSLIGAAFFFVLVYKNGGLEFEDPTMPTNMAILAFVGWAEMMLGWLWDLAKYIKWLIK
jgi:high-affinity Fe2+/Pb2+ permease